MVKIAGDGGNGGDRKVVGWNFYEQKKNNKQRRARTKWDRESNSTEKTDSASDSQSIMLNLIFKALSFPRICFE